MKATDPITRNIRRLWGDLPVVDAEREIRVPLRPEDVSKATRQDPSRCVFAQACLRVFDSTKVLFYRTVAYVELKDEKGVRRVERFSVSSAMRRLVEAFDRGEGKIPDSGCFVLSPPAPYKSFDQKLLYDRQHREAERERRKLDGTLANPHGTQGTGKYDTKPIVFDLVRNGSGNVHFTFKRPAKPKKDGSKKKCRSRRA